MVCGFLEGESDFNRALELVIEFLVKHEAFRRGCESPLSIVEILVLKGYHERVWMNRR